MNFDHKTLRRGLLALALTASLPSAWAELPRDLQVERMAANRIAVVWTGSLVADEHYRVALSDRAGAAADKALAVAGTEGRVELNHPAGQRPYVRVVDDEGRQQVLGERVLPLEAGVNFRDLGGYRSADGRTVRWGKLFRSGVMASLTDADYDYLQRLGIKTICDLRANDERTSEPTQAKRIAPQGRYLSWDYTSVIDGGAFAQAFRAGGDPHDTAMRLMSGFYRTMPRQFAPRYREAFDALKTGDGLLFNCSAGKDRTGLLAALVLTALDVDRDTVVADYALSQYVYAKTSAKLSSDKARQGHGGKEDPNLAMLAKLPEPAIKVLMGVDPALLNAAFDQIRADHGSVDAYLERELGVSAADRARLKELYLEAAPAVAAR